MVTVVNSVLHIFYQYLIFKNINRHEKKQEDITHNQEKIISVESDL